MVQDLYEELKDESSSNTSFISEGISIQEGIDEDLSNMAPEQLYNFVTGFISELTLTINRINEFKKSEQIWSEKFQSL